MECRTEDVREKVARIVSKHGPGRAQLLPVLQDVMDEFGYLSGDVLIEVSRAMDISIGEIHGVASFYHFINTEKVGRYVVRLCKTISCEMQGKKKVEAAIEKELGIRFGGTTPDGLFTLQHTNCLGMCDQGPALMVNRAMFTRVSPERALQILDAYREGREP